MNGGTALTRALAIAGTVLAWLPIVATLGLSAAAWITTREARVDWLMPAELFPIAAVGGLVLLVAALRTGTRRRLVGWSLGATVVSLAGSQGLAIVTGLASGRTQPTGPAWIAVLAGLAVYTLAVATLAVGGTLLVGDAFRG